MRFGRVERRVCTSQRNAIWLAALVGVTIAPAARFALAEDVSQPAILQMFEAKWTTIEDRMADIFQTGYGQMWLPPPERADTGNQSVGYDLFDRFDLGKPRNETLYGTELTLKTAIAAGHNASVKMYTDFLPNHDGFRNQNTSGFAAQGGYPGFVLSTPTDQFGDFHDPSIHFDDPCGCHVQDGTLSGLIDIAQEKNYQMIRQPIVASTPGKSTIPAGTLYNKPDPNNARFYPDRDTAGVALNDPNTGGNFTRYNFNSTTPLAGDPVEENATGLLMRNMQWMIQVMGVDGFRIDAARHMPTWFFNYLDDASFKTSLHTNLDGSIQPIYMFSEVADSNSGNVQPYVRHDLPNRYAISASDTAVKGNRDALDFPLFYAMVSNLSGNGTANNWHSIKNASLDVNDDGLHNGSQGVTFVDSHDDQAGQRPYLYKVAYAYTLMMPGNAVVYENAHEFGTSRTFPYDIGGLSNPMSNDALGGSYWGNDVAKLVDIRNTHGRGNFQERWIDPSFSNIYVFERSKSVIVGLNSRVDDGYDERTGVQTDFAPGTILVELTGNADSPIADPGGNIPQTIRVNANGQVTIRIPRNQYFDTGTNSEVVSGLGYVVYGVAGPQGTFAINNRGTNQVLAGATPSSSNTQRLASIDVVTSNTFSVQLNTTPVSLADPDHPGQFVRDTAADGYTAMIRVDGGVNVNAFPGVDDSTPGSVSYGFENFTNTRNPAFIWNGSTNVGTGSGLYIQNIDATQLSEGRHDITVRAFRYRGTPTSGGDGGPAVYTDFKRTIYVDRLPPTAALVSYDPSASDPNNQNNRDLIVRSTDSTANNMYFLVDYPAALTEDQILALTSGSNQGSFYDRDQFYRSYSGVTRGNHVVTVVTYEITGNYSIKRFSGLYAPSSIGKGFGDTNFSNSYSSADIRGGSTSVEAVIYSQNAQFSPAVDVNGDGLCDSRDLFLLGNQLIANGASMSVLQSYTDLLTHRGDVDGSGTTDVADMAALYASFGSNSWTMDLDAGGLVKADDPRTVDMNDVIAMVTNIFRTVPGDFNLDGVVDAADYLIWRKNRGLSNKKFSDGDANFDQIVDDADLALWRANFGFVRSTTFNGSGAASASVPEPSTLWLIGIVCGLCAIGGPIRPRHQRPKHNC